MMIPQLIAELSSAQIGVRVENGQLKISAAKGKMTPTILAKLKENKAELLAYLEQASGKVRQSGIKPVAVADDYPVSHAQKRLWLFAQMEPESFTYNMPWGFALKGEFDHQHLFACLTKLVQRHESLRTVFIEVDGQARQKLIDVNAVTEQFAFLDIRGNTSKEADVQALADSGYKQFCQHCFDLASGPLMRVTVVKLDENDHQVWLNMHHIISDEWSIGVFHQELATLYNHTGTLQPLPIQYKDYSNWHEQQLTGQAGQKHKAYWLDKLAGPLPVLDLLSDRPRPAQQTFVGHHVGQKWDKALSEQLQQFAKKHGVRQQVLIQTLINVLLHRYTTQEDIIIGSVTAGRDHPDLESQIGFYINPLVFRNTIDPDDSFITTLKRVEQTALEAYEHGLYPFDQIVSDLGVKRDPSRAPLFDIGVNVSTPGSSHAGAPQLFEGLSMNGLGLELGVAKFDLTFTVNVGEQVSVIIEYNTDLYDESTARRLLSHFTALAEDVMQNSDKAVNQLTFIPALEKQQLLGPLSAGPEVAFGNPCLDQLFEAQVERTPERDSVVFDEVALSYTELNEGANKLAHVLVKRGVGPGVLVGLYLDRSADLVTAILAVFKAGGAYVPIATDYPQNRVVYIAEDSQASVFITHMEHQQTLEDWTTGMDKAPVLLSIDDPDLTRDEPAHNPKVPSAPTDLAYIIYTSGTTGNPKGVMINQQNVAHLCASQKQWFGIGDFKRGLLFASYVFDASVFEMFVYLFNGVSLYICNDEQRTNPQLLGELISKNQMDMACLPPAILTVMDETTLSSLKVLVAAGEAPCGLMMERVSKHCPIYNGYGPTENTVCASLHQYKSGDKATNIGRPFNNVQLYVLDKNRQNVAVGVPGELYVGGAGVAVGYLNRPDLTAASFIDNPFGAGRLYKTGDLVRWNAGGELEFVGRVDHQVKIRGFRIELGEIQNQINQLPEVMESTVIVRDDGAGDKSIVAYVVGTEDFDLDFNKVRQTLQQHLPDYMIPAAFVSLAQLPLTINGKIDTRALPKPDVSSLFDQNYVAPETETQKALCAIWQDVLKVERVGISDNFFALGGDSILSIQVASRASQAGLQITTKDIFKCQHIQSLAKEVRQQSAVVAPQQAVVGQMPLLPVQQWFFAGAGGNPHYFNQSILLKAPAGFTSGQLAQIVAALYQRHDALRLRYQQVNGTWQARFQPFEPDMVTNSVVCFDSCDEQGEKCQQLQESLDITNGPLIKAALFGQDTVALFIHHLAVDGVGWRVILEDIAVAWSQLKAAKPVKLAAKTSSYQQWAEHMKDYAHSDEIQAQLPYWQAQVQQQMAPLPMDRNVDDIFVLGGTQEAVIMLEQAQTQQLLTDCAKVYRTRINELLLAALLKAMHNWTGGNTLCLDLEGHGREALFDDLDISETLGWYTNVYPLSLTVDNINDTATLIKSVKEQYRQIPQQGIGYGLLRYMVAEPTLADSVATPMLFNYLGQMSSGSQSDADFAAVGGNKGKDINPLHPRDHVLDFNGLVINGKLRFTLDYNPEQFDKATIQALCAHFEQALRDIIDHCQQPDVGSYTPSDFPLAHINQQQLDQWQQSYPALANVYDATPMQQGMLYHSLLDESGEAYVLQGQYDISGDFDAVAFKKAWQTVVDRHDILRTAFVGMDADVIAQLLVAKAELPWNELDWSFLEESVIADKLTALLKQDRQQGFDFAAPPLMRGTMIAMPGERFQFLWSCHHALIDGWCTPLLLGEVMAVYRHLTMGAALDLQPLTPYVDYVQWLHDQDSQKALAFWQQHLQGITAPTPLTVEGLGLDENAPQFNQLEIKLSPAIGDKLQTLVQTHRLTMNTVVQGAWAILLHLYSAEQNVVYGTTVSGRPAGLAGVEQLIGLFINTLPARVGFADKSQNLLGWLEQLHHDSVERDHFGFTPLVGIQNVSDVARGNSLFDTLVIYQNFPAKIEAAGERRETTLSIKDAGGEEHTNYKLSLVAMMLNAQLVLQLDYQTEHFSQATINRLLGHLEVIFGAMAEGFERPVADIGLLTDAEKQQLTGWQPQEVTEQPSIGQQFEMQVAATPDAAAVTFADNQLSYAELNERANGLAHYLMAEHGVKDGMPVGLCIERSLEMIVGLLAILKAGGAYVPMDPTYPADRLAYMMEDCGAKLVVDLDTFDKLSTLDLATDNPQQSYDTDALAYIIYTSGSTGLPKGVQITHQNLLASTMARKDYYQAPLNGYLLMSSVAFDSSVAGIFWTLTSGGKLCLPDDEGLKDVDYLAQLIEKQKISHLLALPSLYQILLEEGQTESLASLNTVIVAGDVCHSQLVELHNQQNDCTLYNEYGPTEGSVWSSVYDCSQAKPGAPIPIGKPAKHILPYVLDSQGEPVPVGVYGELHIGGQGVAKGYLNHDDLNAEKFIENSFAAGGRLYKTGDLVRWLPDGNLQFNGRIDNQVKIRGFRIETGEIEALLNQQDAVKVSAVKVWADKRGENRLSAYVVGEVEQSTLVAALKAQLPDHMVPSTFVALDELPLTSNGKTDYKQLPQPDESALQANEYVAPRNDTEAQLCQLWQEIFELEQVGIEDNFFALAGHSLMLIRLSAKIKQTLGIKLSVMSLYKQPTISAIAAVIADGDVEQSCLQPLNDNGSENLLICVPYPGADGSVYQPLSDQVQSARSYALSTPDIDGDINAYIDEFVAEVKQLGDDGTRISLWGHCAGFISALYLAKVLEQHGLNVEQVFVGGLIFEADMISGIQGQSIEALKQMPSDDNIKQMMRTGGIESLHGALGDDAWQTILETFKGGRYLSNWCAYHYFNDIYPAKLDAAVISVCADDDVFTPPNAQAGANWQTFSDTVGLHQIAQGGHYFIQTQQQQIGRLIESTQTRENR